ncbi:hypothetical protein HZB00_00210, partial [Candidatus Woesearchaeota archaeon]|nr:hypothetical protein [Candidatus Woesearchaeota archaeon]
ILPEKYELTPSQRVYLSLRQLREVSETENRTLLNSCRFDRGDSKPERFKDSLYGFLCSHLGDIGTVWLEMEAALERMDDRTMKEEEFTYWMRLMEDPLSFPTARV